MLIICVTHSRSSGLWFQKHLINVCILFGHGSFPNPVMYASLPPNGTRRDKTCLGFSDIATDTQTSHSASEAS